MTSCSNVKPMLGLCCCNCPFNDGVCYSSNPVKYRCTVTYKYHEAYYSCGRVGAVYVGETKPSDGSEQECPNINGILVTDNTHKEGKTYVRTATFRYDEIDPDPK